MTSNKEKLPIRHGPPIDPYLREQIQRFEGWDTDTLTNPELEAPYNLYLCAPLQPTERKSALQHITEVAHKASLIENATHEGRTVKCFLPHVDVFPIFNELVHPRAREFGISMNNLALVNCDALVIIGTRISLGMEKEINDAKELGLFVGSFGEFEKKLTNLPTPEETQRVFTRIMRSLPSSIFTEHIVKLGRVSR